jgi:signal peptidase II
MTNDEGMPDRVHRIFRHSCFVIRHSSFSRIAGLIMRFILFLSLPLYALDQLTKQLVLRSINPYDARIVVPDFFNLVNVTNTGAAFGSFRGNNTFFVIISLVALVVVTILLVRHRRVDPWRDVSLALLLAGILGNLTDRLLYGHVIDFLLFNLHIRYADPWPAFNVADSCISIAVVLFIIHSFGKKDVSRDMNTGRGD